MLAAIVPNKENYSNVYDIECNLTCYKVVSSKQKLTSYDTRHKVIEHFRNLIKVIKILNQTAVMIAITSSEYSRVSQLAI